MEDVDGDDFAPTAGVAQGHMDQLRSFLVAEGSNSLLPNALTIPAVLHIIHNMLLELAEKLTHWNVFFGQLKLVSLLLKEGRKERFSNFCLRKSNMKERAEEFERASFPTLYQERFGEVTKFCRAIKPWVTLIRATWDPNSYINGPGVQSRARDKQEVEFDPHKLSTVLDDSFFLLFGDGVDGAQHTTTTCGLVRRLPMSSGLHV